MSKISRQFEGPVGLGGTKVLDQLFGERETDTGPRFDQLFGERVTDNRPKV
jgi:hypothetical protein